MTQPERRPRATGELDLTEIEGSPSPGANHAYAIQGSDIHIDGKSPLPLGGSIRVRLKAAERSQLTSMITFLIAVLAGIAVGFGTRAIGLDPLPAVISGGVIWIAACLFVILRHQRP